MREGNEQRKKRKTKSWEKERENNRMRQKNAAIEGKIKTGRQKVVEENAGRCKKGRRS